VNEKQIVAVNFKEVGLQKFYLNYANESVTFSLWMLGNSLQTNSDKNFFDFGAQSNALSN